MTELVAEQRRGGVSLVVARKPRRRWRVDLLQPALAQRLADHLTCDVLWLPTPAPRGPAHVTGSKGEMQPRADRETRFSNSVHSHS